MKNYKTQIRVHKGRTAFQSATLAILLAALAIFAQATAARAADGDIDATFNASVADGAVGAIVVQTDGKILIGGSFTTIGGAARARVARITNGTGAKTAKKAVLDFDGDGRSDFVVARAADANSQSHWFINNGADLANYKSISFGTGVRGFGFQPPADIAVPGDYDGDGKTDFMLTRNAGGSLVWYLLTRTGATNGIYFGVATDYTVQGDYDGDGKTDIAVWRRNDGTFYVLRSNGSSFQSFQWGQPGDYPVGYYNAH